MSVATTPKIYVAVVGVGLVGAELVEQLLAIPQQTSPFRLISLSSSSRTIFDAENPIQTGSSWKEKLTTSNQRPDFQLLTKQLAALVASGQKVAIVDNTSSDDIAKLYPGWLENGISVVTPNKKAYSGELDLYEKIISASKASGARFLNESTVGAGLPVISTLKELVATGDRASDLCGSLLLVVKIEGVFSGTMSYIFNNFSTGAADGPAFSSVVSVAREKGYTEPHPADDLNGFDVARKLTILTRTITTGSHIPTALPALQTFAFVKTESLIPKPLEGIPSGDEFVSRLPEFDAHFAKLRSEASAEGKVLRFVGVVDVAGGVVKAGLEKYSTSHPFATSLGGSDNIIMFHTERYGARPLIVQGAGAGAAVTAMGVLGDLFKLA
ncbi:Homoserine dehydrogenase [Termitomyces sp. J132]|nr:Homoserine dehydrogenase [Termitomyces sp. J132]